MSDHECSHRSGSCSLGCFGIVAIILLIWALCFGLPVNDKVLNIDLFPPAITYR